MSKKENVKNMIKPVFDLAGQKFGEITVLYRTRSTGKRGSYWMCRCSCGVEFEKRGGAIREMTTDRCMGCWFEKKKAETREREDRIREESATRYKEKQEESDLSGMRFGQFSVLRPKTGLATKGFYICKCDCGSEKDVLRKDLISDKATRCSECVKKERAEIKRAKIDIARKEGIFECRCCQTKFDLSNILESDLRRGDFICNKCDNEYKNRWKKKNYERNKELSEILCLKCGEGKKLDEYFDIALYQKIPTCRVCFSAEASKKFKIFRAINLDKKEITCSECSETYPLEDYVSSQLNLKEPRCRKCFYKKKREYISVREKEDPILKEKRVIGNRIKHSLQKGFFRKDGTTVEYLGCSRDEFVKHIEDQFIEGMSWANRAAWHLDHIIPLATATTSEEIKALWHYTNLRPLWGHENEAKGKNLNFDLEEYRKRFKPNN